MLTRASFKGRSLTRQTLADVGRKIAAHTFDGKIDPIRCERHHKAGLAPARQQRVQ